MHHLVKHLTGHTDDYRMPGCKHSSFSTGLSEPCCCCCVQCCCCCVLLCAMQPLQCSHCATPGLTRGIFSLTCLLLLVVLMRPRLLLWVLLVQVPAADVTPVQGQQPCTTLLVWPGWWRAWPA